MSWGQAASLAPAPAEMRAHFDAISRNWRPLPPLVANAFIAAEHRRFLDRDPGIAPLARRVAMSMLSSKQDAAILKAKEITLTESILRALTADEVVMWYTHVIYLGQGCRGLDAAAAAYFGKPAERLTLAEAAMLAALARDSSGATHPARLREYRDHVLDAMVEIGATDQAAANIAKSSSLRVINPPVRCDWQ